MTERPRVCVVVPAYNEGEQIVSVLDRLFESVRLAAEVLVVVDSADDTTIPVTEEYAQKEPRLRCLINTYGQGPANAIRFGIDAAAAPVVVVTMADGCDDARQIDDLVRLVERGVAVGCRVPLHAGRSAGRRPHPQGHAVPYGRPVAARAGSRGDQGRDELVQGLLDGIRPAGGHRLAGRVRDRHRADRQGQAAAPAGGGDPDHLAGPAGGRVELQGGQMGAQLRPLVPFRVRTAADRRSGAEPRVGPQPEQRNRQGS